MDIGMNPMFFRLCRLAKLVRLIRVLRFLNMLDSLQLIVSSIMASFSILVWSALLLTLLFAMCAIALNYMLFEYLDDRDGSDIEMQHRIYRYFGTFTRALLTMFEITLGNWIPACRAL